MTDLILGLFFILVLLLIVSFPSGFRRVMARISFQDESMVPEYPIGAAVPIIALLTWWLVVPGMRALIGVTRLATGMNRLLLVLPAFALVLAGLSLTIWPQRLSPALPWTKTGSAPQAFVARLIGTAVLIAGAWLLQLGLA